ncbi:MAG: DUF4382 domain-containing protein [Cyanobacteria bacterium P01_G01_bin.67]
MNQLRTIAYGITLGSLIISSLGQQDRGKTIAASTETATLALVANGEDFVRQGFVSKDGWQIDFERAYVNISDAIAYSTESAFDPKKGDTKEDINYQEQINFDLPGVPTDLAAGTADAEPIVVTEADVTPGFYNALAWKLSTAGDASPIAGKTIALIGQATKDGATVNFNLGFNQPMEYICGEFIGDSRLGIVTPETPGKVETTFHFDHIFGDQNSPPADALNQAALGFQPLANLASNGTLEVDQTALREQLSSSDYQQLTKAISGLGHVGEGHCVVTNSQ